MSDIADQLVLSVSMTIGDWRTILGDLDLIGSVIDLELARRLAVAIEKELPKERES